MGPARARTCQHSKHSRRFLLRSHENTQNTALFRTAFVWPLLDVMTQDNAQPAASLRLLDLGRDSLIKVLELLDVPSIARAAQVRRLRLGSYFNWVLGSAWGAESSHAACRGSQRDPCMMRLQVCKALRAIGKLPCRTSTAAPCPLEAPCSSA